MDAERYSVPTTTSSKCLLNSLHSSPKTYKPLDSALKRIQEYEWLILTSVNGAEALGQRLKHLQIKPHTLAHLRIVAIRPATRDAITRLGLKVAVVPDRYIAESLVERL